MILRQRRRPHRSGLIPKGELLRTWKERHPGEQEQREPAASETEGKVNQVTTAEIVIPQTEAGSGNFYEFEPDVYDAIVSDIEQVDNPFEDDKTQLQFTFEIPGYSNEDGTPATKRAWANPVWNAKSKLWKWASVILGETPAPGEPFRTSTLIGKPCRVVMNADTNQKGDKIIKITDVLGSQKPAAKPKPGLVAKLKAEERPDEVKVDYCSTQGCTAVAEIYTSRGTPFCEQHAP